MRKILAATVLSAVLISGCAADAIEKNIPAKSDQTEHTEKQTPDYYGLLTDDEKQETQDIMTDYYDNSAYGGVYAAYPAENSDPMYCNEGVEGEYTAGNIVIYKVITEKGSQENKPERSISIGRKDKSSSWKVINEGY